MSFNFALENWSSEIRPFWRFEYSLDLYLDGGWEIRFSKWVLKMSEV